MPERRSHKVRTIPQLQAGAATLQAKYEATVARVAHRVTKRSSFGNRPSRSSSGSPTTSSASSGGRGGAEEPPGADARRLRLPPRPRGTHDHTR
jgi:hypothetical protein